MGTETELVNDKTRLEPELEWESEIEKLWKTDNWPTTIKPVRKYWNHFLVIARRMGKLAITVWILMTLLNQTQGDYYPQEDLPDKNPSEVQSVVPNYSATHTTSGTVVVFRE